MPPANPDQESTNGARQPTLTTKLAGPLLAGQVIDTAESVPLAAILARRDVEEVELLPPPLCVTPLAFAEMAEVCNSNPTNTNEKTEDSKNRSLPTRASTPIGQICVS